MKLQIKKINKEATIPTRAHTNDAGMDLYALENVLLNPNQSELIKTGISLSIPKGYFGKIEDRSSLGKKGLKTLGGVIDSGYRGEVKVIMRNLSNKKVIIEKKTKIAQLIIIKIETPTIEEVKELDNTERGSGGFGSSGWYLT